MKKYLFLIFMLVCFFNIVLAANDIKISTKVVNERLIPVININNQIVLEVLDKGSFISSFDRAEHIYSVLVEVEEKGLALKNIQIRRSKKNYIGVIDKIQVFEINRGDSIAYNMSAYKLATHWLANIKKALVLKKDAQAKQINSDNEIDVLLQKNFKASVVKKTNKNMFPLMGIINTLGRLNVLAFLQYLIIFAVIQMLISFAVFKYLSNKDKNRNEEYLKIQTKVENLQNTVIYLKKELKFILSEKENKKINSKSIKQPAPAKQTQKTTPKAPILSKSDEIYRLEKEGKTALEISKVLNISLGEVVLNLNLKKKNND